MTPEQVKQVCAKYAGRLEAKGATPVRNADAPTVAGRMNHLRWMCDEVPRIVDENVEKAMRWLGFMQGAMMVLDVMTVAEMKEDNR